MEKEYLVTVVIPTYNAGRYIGKAMESVFNQTLEKGIEIIVIDDNSNDGTDEIVKGFVASENYGYLPRHVEYVVNEERLGVAGSRNKAVSMAKGDYIAFLDADDWWSSNKLKYQVEYMQANDNVPLCCCARELMDSQGISTDRIIGVADKITYKMLLKTNSIACASVLIRREVAQRYPMHNDELHEDYICWLEILKEYEYVHGINEPMLKSRLSEGGKSRNKLRSLKMNYGVYRLMGMSVGKSLYYLGWYTINGIRKYYV